MIALPQSLPYVVWRQERLLPLSENWLAESIRTGAARAGYGGWDLAPHIARAIVAYLEEEFASPTISISQVEEMIVQSIAKIGYGEIARATDLVAPQLNVSLSELAGRAPYEILFYPLLRDRLDEAMAIEARGVVFGDLRPCVKILDSAARWRRTCDMLRGQIVRYIRDYLAGIPGRNLEFAIV